MSHLQAFHHLGNKNPFKVLRSGSILPPSLIYSVDEIAKELEKYINGLEGNETARKAVEAIAERRLLAITRSQDKYDTHPNSMGRYVDDLDLLAGESEYVFFGPQWWTILGCPPKNGLILDADTLIQDGAGVRLEDMNDDYRLAIEDAMDVEWRSVKEAERSLLKTLDDLRKPLLFGKEASRFWRRDALSREHLPELIYEGPVDLTRDIVVGILMNGSEVPRSQWSRFS
jgi:hypothetical protein